MQCTTTEPRENLLDDKLDTLTLEIRILRNTEST